MKINTIVTLDEEDKWLLTDMTEQSGNKYFLGLRVDDNDKPLDESRIFMEEVDGGETYLLEINDEKELEQISAIFIKNFDNKSDAE